MRRSGKSWSFPLLASVTLHSLTQGAKGNLTARAPRKNGGRLPRSEVDPMVLLSTGDEVIDALKRNHHTSIHPSTAIHYSYERL